MIILLLKVVAVVLMAAGLFIIVLSALDWLLDEDRP